MYFTNTPAPQQYGGDHEKTCPTAHRKAEVGFADCINTPRKTAIADFVSTTEKKRDAP